MTPRPAALVERDAELQALRGWLAEARSGAGRTVFVAGEAGVGKTALLTAFAATSGVPVLRGACDALATPRALGPILDIAAEHGGVLRMLATKAASRDAIFEAFRDALGRRTSLVVLEDVHWADESTLDLVRLLGRRSAASRSLLVATYRDEQVDADHPLRRLLGDLATTAGVQRLVLPPLTPGGVTQLASGHAVDPAELHRLTGGNPFFVTEVLEAGGEHLPATVRNAVLARTARLSTAARTVLGAVSIGPAGAEPEAVAALAGLSSTAMDECVRAGVLDGSEGRLVFRHELARLAVHGDLPPGRRQKLNDGLVRWLLANAARHDPARIAHHAEEAGRDELVLASSRKAAERATRLGAYREAASHLESALRYEELLEADELADLLERHSRMRYLVSPIEDAIASRRRAIALRHRLGDVLAEGDGLRWLSRFLWVGGRNADAEAAAAAALEVLAGAPPGRELAMAYSNLSQLAMLAREHERAIEHGTRAIALAEKLGDIEALSHALNNVGTARLMSREYADGLSEVERSLSLARRADLGEHAARAYCNLGSAPGEVRDYALADRWLVEGEAYCDERDLDYFGNYIRAWRSRTHFEQGRWPEAEEWATPVAGPHVAAVTRIVALTVLGRLAVRRGADEDGSLSLAWELAALTNDLQRTWPVAAAIAEAVWYGRRDSGELDLVHRVLRDAIEHGHPWAAGELAFWLERNGALAGLPDAVAEPFRVHLDGDPQTAARLWRSIGCPYEVALVLLDADDVGRLRDALAIAKDLGAVPLSERIARRLREIGVHARSLHVRQSTKDNPAGLTDRQLEVLGLVAQGLRDAEIAERLSLSTRTVGHHVSAVLRKLDVRSRAEAAVLAVQLGMLETDGPQKIGRTPDAGGGPRP